MSSEAQTLPLPPQRDPASVPVLQLEQVAADIGARARVTPGQVVRYVQALAAPYTVNTMPEATLKALAAHGELAGLMPADGGDCEAVLAEFGKAGIDIDALAARLQDEGAKSFVASWNDLMGVIASKSASLGKSNPLKAAG